jgi:hypothetical protein
MENENERQADLEEILNRAEGIAAQKLSDDDLIFDEGFQRLTEIIADYAAHDDESRENSAVFLKEVGRVCEARENMSAEGRHVLAVAKADIIKDVAMFDAERAAGEKVQNDFNETGTPAGGGGEGGPEKVQTGFRVDPDALGPDDNNKTVWVVRGSPFGEDIVQHTKAEIAESVERGNINVTGGRGQDGETGDDLHLFEDEGAAGVRLSSVKAAREDVEKWMVDNKQSLDDHEIYLGADSHEYLIRNEYERILTGYIEAEGQTQSRTFSAFAEPAQSQSEGRTFSGFDSPADGQGIKGPGGRGI